MMALINVNHKERVLDNRRMNVAYLVPSIVADRFGLEHSTGETGGNPSPSLANDGLP
jgi:hypothetical protein